MAVVIALGRRLPARDGPLGERKHFGRHVAHFHGGDAHADENERWKYREKARVSEESCWPARARKLGPLVAQHVDRARRPPFETG